MHAAIPLSLCVLVSIAIISLGCFYIVAPQKVVGSFGLRPPPLDSDTVPWLRLKGIRDIASGVSVLVLMLTTDSRTVGIAIVVLAFIPLGDMSNVLASGGRRATAFAVHGLTCVVMLFAGLLLIHVL